MPGHDDTVLGSAGLGLDLSEHPFPVSTSLDALSIPPKDARERQPLQFEIQGA